MARPRKTLEQLKQTGTYQNHKGRYKELEEKAEKFRRLNIKEFDEIEKSITPHKFKNEEILKMEFLTLLKLFDNKILMATDECFTLIAFRELDGALTRIKELPNKITDTKRLLVELKIITTEINAYKALIKNFQIDGLEENAADYELKDTETLADYIRRIKAEREKRANEKPKSELQRILDEHAADKEKP